MGKKYFKRHRKMTTKPLTLAEVESAKLLNHGGDLSARIKAMHDAEVAENGNNPERN